MNLRVKKLSKPMIISYRFTALKCVFYNFGLPVCVKSCKRYYITVSILRRDPEIARGLLEKESQLVAQRLSVLHGINAPEFFDKAVFSAFIAHLKEEGYFDDDKEKLHELATILEHLISSEICLTINGAADKADEVEIEVEEEDKSSKDE